MDRGRGDAAVPDDADTTRIVVRIRAAAPESPERDVTENAVRIPPRAHGDHPDTKATGLPTIAVCRGNASTAARRTSPSPQPRTVDDDEDEVKLSFGTLPTGVDGGHNVGDHRITDDDYPIITASAAATYSDTDEDHGPGEHSLYGDLQAAPWGGLRDAAARARNGESILLGFGSGTTTTTVTIIDDDPAVAVTIRTSTAEVEEGERARFLVEFPEPPVRPLSIPLVFTYQGGADADDLTNIPTSVEFAANDDGSEVFFLFTVDDTIADHGESIQVSFGTDLPPGVSVSSFGPTATVTIIDDDPAVTASFGAATYSVTEGDSVDVTVTLSADPMRPVTIPVTATGQGGATSTDDYTDPTGVTFNSGDTTQTISFSITEDTLADHGESVRLAFGSDLPPGVTLASTNRTTTVTIIDDDPAVTVSFAEATLDVIEGETAKVFLTLTLTPQRPFTIQVTVTNQGGAGSEDHHAPATYNIEFDANDPAKRINIQVSQDTLVERGEGVKLAIVSDLPPGVSLGAVGEQTVNFIDDDPAVTVSFGAATYSADEGDSVDVTVTLSADPQRSVTIPIAGAGESGGTSADFSIPASVTFASGDTSKTISFTATDDTIDDDDEKVRLNFGTFPPGVSSGSTSSTTVSINDNDDPELTVMFGNAAYTATEGGTTTVSVTLNADPERTVVVPGIGHARERRVHVGLLRHPFKRHVQLRAIPASPSPSPPSMTISMTTGRR